MSKAKVYVTKGGLEIHNPKLFVFATTSKAGNKTDRYMIKGQTEAGVVKTSFIGKADIAKWGKATRMEAKPAKARKSCKAKFEECEAKKSTKRASKKAAKKSPKKAESEDEEESASAEHSEEPRDEVSEESEQESASSSVEEKKPVRKAKAKPKAKGKGKK